MSTASLPTLPNITPNDRFMFALFLSIIIHMMVIFGVGFTMPTASHKPATLDITLTRYKSDKAPAQADYLAQNNQEGSGTEEEKKLLATTELRPYQSNEPKPMPATPQRETPVESSQTKIVSVNKNTPEKLSATTKKQKTSTPDDAPKSNKTLLQRSLEVASLTANLDYHQQALSKKPNTKRLSSLSTMSAVEAYYFDTWRRKVELVGNLNYPAEARQQKIYGSLRLSVTLLPNGKVESIELLESSGHKILDDAAIRIVKMAGPFAPFTPEMKKNFEKYELIRTFQFLRDDSLVSG